MEQVSPLNQASAAGGSDSSGRPKTLDPAAIAAELAKLATSAQGLTTSEAQKRLAKDGPNAIIATEEPLWHKAVGYFWGPIPWMIEAAALISFLRHDWPDFFVVMGLLIYNAAVGFWQDAKAANALAALRKGLALKAEVLRDGKWLSIDATDLVVGDVTEVTAGEIVPADLLLIGGSYLSIDQAALTGESLPVGKAVGDVAYSGSIAKQGDMQGAVTAIGNATFFGRTAKLVASAGAKSHSQKAVVQIGDFLILLAGALAVVLVGVQVYRQMVVPGHWSWDAAGQITQFILVLLVASVPVALPAVMSVTLALGALALSKQKAIVSRLSAIDELAGVDVLCSDKTGTLTQNKRTMTTVVDASGKTWQYAKGAPQAISALCKLDPTTEGSYSAKVDDLAKHGYRALGVANSADDGLSWTLLGLLPLQDPPRPDAKATIAQTKGLGLSVKMVTGDDVAIGSEIAEQLGLGTHLLVAGDVFPEKTEPDHIPLDEAKAVERADGFGRVFPQHKYEIVKSLQELGHIVAMTGDGVNDAPALKQADCGIAVSGATDAARGAAALILTAPGLSTIINAIRVSREIFQRINSYVFYRIAMTIAIMLVVVLSSVLFDIQPLTAIMIVALALLDDIPIMTIAYDNVRTAPTPVRWDMHRILVFSGIMGLMATAQSFGLVLFGIEWMNDPAMMAKIPLDHGHLQTMLFLQLAAGGHMLLFVVRSRGSIVSPPLPAAQLFLAIVATQIVAVLMCAFGILVPALPWTLIGIVWAYVIVWTILTDLVKLAFIHFTASAAVETPLTAHTMGLR